MSFPKALICKSDWRGFLGQKSTIRIGISVIRLNYTFGELWALVWWILDITRWITPSQSWMVKIYGYLTLKFEYLISKFIVCYIITLVGTSFRPSENDYQMYDLNFPSNYSLSSIIQGNDIRMPSGVTLCWWFEAWFKSYFRILNGNWRLGKEPWFQKDWQ